MSSASSELLKRIRILMVIKDSWERYLEIWAGFRIIKINADGCRVDASSPGALVHLLPPRFYLLTVRAYQERC